MKVVINKCYGGFGLSPLAVKRLAELKGRPCYFFTQDIKAGLGSPFIPATIEQAEKAFIFFAFDIPDPNDTLPRGDTFAEKSLEERQAHNAIYDSHALDSRPRDRSDADLVRVVEELGPKANGAHADLAIVEIPDGTDYVIEEDDGREHIAEAHRTWG